MEIQKIGLPNFNLDPSKVPDVKIKSIRFQNFKAFEDATFDFTSGGKCKPFLCFFGGNGCGKTTILDTIQLLFTRFEGREDDQIKYVLGKSVRHIDGKQNGIYGTDDFLITAKIHSSVGDYDVLINKNGFINDHPLEVKSIVYRICYYARFDQELNIFQLNRDKWAVFKGLFEAVTGFEIEEIDNVFDESDDPVQSDILRKYVLGFYINKPDETITHKECSAGEKKIIKSFSTLLNKEYIPSIICVDNVEMHVEAGRHLQLIDQMKKSFPDSQIFTATHSHQISKNFGDRNQLYDLRLIKLPEAIRKEKWRFYLADEIRDSLSKLESLTIEKKVLDREIVTGRELLRMCLDVNCNFEDDYSLIERSEMFLKCVAHLFVSDITSYYQQERD